MDLPLPMTTVIRATAWQWCQWEIQ